MTNRRFRLDKFSIGVGDRFAHQAKAQLEACVLASQSGVDVIPVWNKSNREHNLIGSEPASTRAAAEAAVKALGWTKPYYCDADHINLQTVGRFLASCDFYTIDVADFIAKKADQSSVDAFVRRHSELVGEIKLRPTEIQKRQIDVAFVGIGENGHLAFNDPPADFQTEESYIVVDLDEACRRQQLGEGWFRSLADVPRRAISMTVRQILKSKEIICVVPDTRKAKAVAKCLQGEITPLAPASILRTHSNTSIYLDKDSSALLRPEITAAAEVCQKTV